MSDEVYEALTSRDPFVSEFVTAARAEAEAVIGEARERVGITVREQTRYIEGHVAGAKWARSQEPTEEEVEALVDSLDWAIRGTTDGDRIDQDSELPVGEVVRLIHEGARAALSAARKASKNGG